MLDQAARRDLIGSDCNISVAKQCQLLGVPRSTFYYEPRPESTENLRLMRLIDQLYLKAPSYGHRSITTELKKMGEEVNRKRIRRLMHKMGQVAIYPRPRFKVASKDDYKYPYLLNGLKVKKPNQVWGSDITFIPTEDGYLYLVAIVNLYSRYVVSWVLSNNMEVEFCIQALKKALKTGFKPEIINTDQGSQFTSKSWTTLLKKEEITISMSGKGRCWDNIFVERLWRSLKYEEVYLKGYTSAKEARSGIDSYFNFYNRERSHTGIGSKVPQEVYFGA